MILSEDRNSLLNVLWLLSLLFIRSTIYCFCKNLIVCDLHLDWCFIRQIHKRQKTHTQIANKQMHNNIVQSQLLIWRKSLSITFIPHHSILKNGFPLKECGKLIFMKVLLIIF